MTVRRRLLFRRAFRNYTGGHGKVLDYMAHADAHPDWEAHVFVTADSARQGNPFLAHPRHHLGDWSPAPGDAMFIAGEDWSAWPRDEAAHPVINLVQGTRHADPALPLRQFLARRAIRICVSAAVAEAIESTHMTVGPIHVIEPGLSVSHASPVQRGGIFVYGHKQPALGGLVAASLRDQGHGVRLQTGLVSRAAFLAELGAADIAVLLPHAEEGFFLPGLEAMALGCAVVVPDCRGNRAYAVDGGNALVPSLAAEPLVAAVNRIAGDPFLRQRLAREGVATAARFSMDRERDAFHRLLEQLDGAWAGT